jgi:hypothetical protein
MKAIDVDRFSIALNKKPPKKVSRKNKSKLQKLSTNDLKAEALELIKIATSLGVSFEKEELIRLAAIEKFSDEEAPNLMRFVASIIEQELSARDKNG